MIVTVGLPSNSRSQDILRDFSYLQNFSDYWRYIGIYFHIREVEDHNNDISDTETVTVDFQIQGHAKFYASFLICVCIYANGRISMSIPTIFSLGIMLKA